MKEICKTGQNAEASRLNVFILLLLLEKVVKMGGEQGIEAIVVKFPFQIINDNSERKVLSDVFSFNFSTRV